MKTAVVILNWNGRDLLGKFLPTLLLHTTLPDTEIIVADNASTDDSVAFVQQYFPTVSIIRLDKNYGFAEGYNRALKQVQADYYVLLNSDVEVTENWLTPLIAHIETHPNVAACQPKIKAYHNKTHFEHAGACGGLIDKFGYPFCRGRIMSHTEQDRGQYDHHSPQIAWASGACLGIKSEAFHSVGGFDGAFFAHMEEIDLCWRLTNRGYEIHCVPQSTVYHVGGATLATESPRKTYLNFRNNLLMLYKNLPNKRLLWVMFVRLFMDYAAMSMLIFTGKWANAKAIIKARMDFLKMRKDFKQKRNENTRKTCTTKPHIWENRSIVWDFYMKGMRDEK